MQSRKLQTDGPPQRVPGTVLGPARLPVPVARLAPAPDRVLNGVPVNAENLGLWFRGDLIVGLLSTLRLLRSHERRNDGRSKVRCQTGAQSRKRGANEKPGNYYIWIRHLGSHSHRCIPTLERREKPPSPPVLQLVCFTFRECALLKNLQLWPPPPCLRSWLPPPPPSPPPWRGPPSSVPPCRACPL